MIISYYPAMTRVRQDEAERRGPGRPREFDMDEALGKALVVFSERGYHAASLSELRNAMQLTTGSLYKAFADKRAIFLATLDHYIGRRDALLRERMAPACSGRDKLQVLLRSYAESASDKEGRRGCLVVNSATELATFDADTAARVRAAMERVESALRELVRLGQSDGSIRPDLDVEPVAGALFCVIQGLRVAGKSGRTRAQMTGAADQALRMLD